MTKHVAAAEARGSGSSAAKWQTWATSGSGKGLTRDGGSSDRCQAWYIDARRKSSCPKEFRRGSGAPILVYAWPTARTASSTVRARTDRRPGAMEPHR
jgi:hypothetical protein